MLHPYLICIIILRAFLCLSLLKLSDHLLKLDSNLFWQGAASLVGILLGVQLALRNIRSSMILIGTVATIIFYHLCFYLLNQFAPDSNLFFFINIFNHLDLTLGLIIILTWSSLLIFRARIYPIAEVLIFILSFQLIFSLHQNYRFDLIKIINEISWNTGYPPLGIIIAASFGLISLVSFYLFVLGHLSFEDRKEGIHFHQIFRSKKVILTNLLSFFLLIGLFWIISNAVYQAHQAKYEIAVQNGVGTASESGVSPLNFNSALGGSNQPAALVRLENDYPYNPHAPMLYLRESALSTIKGNELILANKDYDLDTSRTKIYQTYLRKELLPYQTDRVEVSQKVYLLGDHQLAFGLDYPQKITPLRLHHNKQNFKGAYKVISLAPAYNPEQVLNYPIGDPNWDQKTWQHYTTNHQDVRYQKLALEITKETYSPVEQVLAITQYLNQNATYTLAPNHQVDSGGDPTAVFLFGDLRGYCVHFAHATVYMLRSLGIPSCIGTGYLTDFSQAKDGHILLRMSDRHAWAEVFISQLGWIPFDVHPEKVESHAETPVDQNLLDSLIDTLGTDEEIISEDLLDTGLEKNKLRVSLAEFLNIKKLIFMIVLILIITYLRKFYIYQSWRFVKNPNRRIRHQYRSQLAMTCDLGFAPISGETKSKYHLRLSKSYPGLGLEIVNILNKINYSAENSSSIVPPTSNELWTKLSNWQKIRVIINPQSAFRRYRRWP